VSKDILAKAAVTVIVMIAFAVLFDRPHKDLQPFINPPDILTSHRSGAIPPDPTPPRASRATRPMR
jgi:hypothetical protein